MKFVTVRELNSHTSQILKNLPAIVTRHGKPVARISPFEEVEFEIEEGVEFTVDQLLHKMTPDNLAKLAK